MTDQSMMDQPMDDGEFDGLMDPVEQKQLDSLQQIVEALGQVVQGLQIIAQQQEQTARILMADRVVTSRARDGRELTAISSIKG